MSAAQTAERGAAIKNPASEDYFSRAIPEPYCILGLKLRPLSVGRYRLLKRFNVAFVADEAAEATVQDLLLGVLICSMRVEEFVEFAASPNFTKEVRRWSRAIFPHPWICALPFIGKWWRGRHAFNIVEKMNLFERYIADAQKIPRYTMRHNSPSTNQAHWSHNIEICLRSELGWTGEEINEQPLSKALADYFRHAENQGTIRVLSDEDFEMADYNAKQIEAALAAMNN